MTLGGQGLEDTSDQAAAEERQDQRPRSVSLSRTLTTG